YNYFWLTPDWQTLFVARGKRKATRVEQDGKRLMRWEFGGDVRAWDMATGQVRKTYRHQPPHNVRHMQLSPDGTKFVTYEEVPGTYERAPKQAASLWDVASGRSLPLLDGMETYGAFSSDSQALAITTE